MQVPQKMSVIFTISTWCDTQNTLQWIENCSHNTNRQIYSITNSCHQWSTLQFYNHNVFNMWFMNKGNSCPVLSINEM